MLLDEFSRETTAKQEETSQANINKEEAADAS